MSTPFTLVREYNHWRLAWKWDYVFPGFQPTDKLSLELQSEDVCQIVDVENHIVMTYQPWPVLYLLPNVIDKRADRALLLTEMELLTGLIPAEIEGLYQSNAPEDLYARIAPLRYNYVGSKLEQLKEVRGIITKDELVWAPMRDLSETAIQQATEITQSKQLDHSAIPGQLLRERRNNEPFVIFENKQSNQDCRYSISD